MYKKRVTDIDSMTNLSLKIRARLNEIAVFGRSAPIDCQTSVDGTRKYLFKVDSGEMKEESTQFIESVFIPPLKHSSTQAVKQSSNHTLCISCQRGCKMGCRFCVTGKQGFHGSLTTAEILNQIFEVDAIVSDPTQAIKQSGIQAITNVVYMGMGEPMDNFEAVKQSIEVLTSDWGLGWSPQRITVSSVGIIPTLKRLLDETHPHVAVSLHSPFPDEREQIMPVEKAYPIEDVLKLLNQYNWYGQRRISFEYIMFRGLNDDLRHAAALCGLLKRDSKSSGLGERCRVNLIRFHTSPDMPYRTSSEIAIDNFCKYLNDQGITCTIRASRGEDIMAACGLLAGKGVVC